MRLADALVLFFSISARIIQIRWTFFKDVSSRSGFTFWATLYTVFGTNIDNAVSVTQ